MNIKIGNKDFKYWESLRVSLQYGTVSSSFGFNATYNPDNATQKQMFQPGAFPNCVVQHDGETLLTGVLWPTSFVKKPEPDFKGFAGYSSTGVLEVSAIPKEAYPLQYNNLSIKQIATKMLNPFGISLEIDSDVADAANADIETVEAQPTQTVSAFLSELCAQKNIILTHTAAGKLLLTRRPSVQKPILDFEQSIPGQSFFLSFDGARLHSHITVRGQSSINGGNAREHTITNPYVINGYRPHSINQTMGTGADTATAAKNALAAELRAVQLTVNIDRWTVDGSVIKPGSIISVKDPDQYLYKKTKFFIERVDLTGTADQQEATLSCVLPEVYNGGTPKNIFL